MTQNIELKNLVASTLNVRKVSTDNAADAQLLASIKSIGVLQNLIVVPTGKKNKYEVVAGGRRFSALTQLLEEKVIDGSYPVPCQVKKPEEATTVSLSENVMRQAMHPVDEFLAFKAMIDNDGATIKDVAIRFGVSQVFVKRRLKLANVAPLVLDAYKSDKIDLDDVMAFTVSDDQSLQESCYKELSRGGLHPVAIKKWLLNDTVKSTDPIAKMVGLPAYRKGGGKTSSDLFSNDVFLLDRGVLHQLAEDRMNAEVSKLLEDGWKWVKHEYGTWFRRIDYVEMEPSDCNVPESLIAEISDIAKQLEEMDDMENEDWTDDIDAQYRALEDLQDEKEAERETHLFYTAEQKSASGCVLHLDHQGNIVTEYGLLDSSDIVHSRKEASAQSGVGDEKSAGGFSNSVVADIALYRQQILRFAIARNPQFAHDLLLFSLCERVLSDGLIYERSLSLRCDPCTTNTKIEDLDATASGVGLSKIYASLPLSFLLEEDYTARFSQFTALDSEQKFAIAAYCTALLFSQVDNRIPTPFLGFVEEHLDIHYAALWRPTENNFFNRLTKADLIEMGQSWFGNEWKETFSRAKKSDICAYLDRFFGGSTDDPLTKQMESIRESWLPDGFYEVPC